MFTILKSSASILKPNVASLGYALFLAVNAAGVWAGVFPFLPTAFQTPQILLLFFMAQAFVFSMSYFLAAVAVYFFPTLAPRFFLRTASLSYFAGWCFLIAALYFDTLSEILVVFGGMLLGYGSAGFYLMWQRLFASQEAQDGTRDLIAGTAYASLLYFALYLIPRAVTVFLIPLVFLPLFGLCIALKSRTVKLDQPMFEDRPRQHPKIYLQLIRDYWRSAFAIGTLGFCVGVMRSLAVGDPDVGALVNIMSMASSFLAAVLLLLAWRLKRIRLNITMAYRLLFPFLITAFALLPFLMRPFIGQFSSVLYAVYSCAIMLMMIQCAQAARDRGINPVFIYCFFGGVVYFLHDLGFMLGTFADVLTIMNFSPLGVVALVAIYLLGLLYFVGNGGFRQVLDKQSASAENIELLALQPAALPMRAALPTPAFMGDTAGSDEGGKDGAGDVSGADGMGGADGVDGEGEGEYRGGNTYQDGGARDRTHNYRDRISKQAERIKEIYQLSSREAEVMELIARGKSVLRIADELVVSENTIRTHSRRIYTKLAIHSKQQLLDLLDEF